MDASNTPQIQPGVLSYSRALVGKAKQIKTKAWWLEGAASALSVGTAFTSHAALGTGLALLAVATKFMSKVVAGSAKRSFRLGERMRRYDFYERTLGWLPPPSDRADMVLAQQAKALAKIAAEIAPREIDYYSHVGTQSTERLFSNLAESMFFTGKLMGVMSGRRWLHLSLAATIMIATLVGLALGHQLTWTPLAIKMVGVVVSLLVAVDLFGEAKSFSRGEKEAEALLAALVAEMRSADPKRDEALRLLVEYNCLLADLPMISDAAYGNNQPVLTNAWTAFEQSLPTQFRGSNR